MLINAKAMHRFPRSKTSAADSKIRSPSSPSLAPKDTETSFIGSMSCSDATKLAENDVTFSPNVTEADRVELNPVRFKTESDNTHIDASDKQANVTVSAPIRFEDPIPRILDSADVDVMSNDTRTSKYSDTHVTSCSVSIQPKMRTRLPEQNNKPSITSTMPWAPDTSDELATDAPGLINYNAPFAMPPSSEVDKELIGIDTRFDEVCTTDNITQSLYPDMILTSTEVLQSPVQAEQNLDAFSEFDASESDVYRASVSNSSPKSITSSIASTVASTSSMSAPHEERHISSEKSMENNARENSSVDSQSVDISQPQAPTGTFGYSELDFRSLGSSLRPRFQVEFPASNEITSSSMSLADSNIRRPIAGSYTTQLASQPWFAGDMLLFEQTKSGVTEPNKYGPQRSTACNHDIKTFESLAKLEPRGSANPHHDVYEIKQDKVPASLSRPYPSIESPSVPPAALSAQPVEAARTHPFFCFTFSMNSKNEPCDREVAKVPLDQCRTDQTIRANGCPRALSRDEEDRRLHTYKPNAHTIAALMVEERNMTKRSLNHSPSDVRVPAEHTADSEPDVIDTSFIPQAVQQHAESQKKKSRQAADQRGSQRGTKAKKLKKNTGRLNKERLCVEKVIQSANEEVVDTPEKADMAEEEFTDLSFPKDGWEGDSMSKRTSKKKERRRLHRQKASQTTQTEQQSSSTHKIEVSSSPTTISLQGTDIEDHLCTEVTSDHGAEAQHDTKSLENSTKMDLAPATPELPKSTGVDIVEVTGHQVEISISDTDNGAIPQESVGSIHHAVEAVPEVTSVDALETTPIRRKDHDTTSTASNLPDTTHDITTETTSDGDTVGGDCHTAAALEDVGQCGLLGNQVLTPIHETEADESVEPQAHSIIEDAVVEPCQLATPSSAPELAGPSLPSDDTGTSNSQTIDVQPKAHMQLKHYVQQPLQQSPIGYIKPGPFHEFIPQPLAYNDGVWPDYGPREPIPNYHHPMEQNVSHRYPFTNQLTAYCTPAFNYDLHASIPEPRYFEPFYGQDWGFYHDHLGRPQYDPNAYTTASRAPMSWREWKPYAERGVGQPFGTHEHRLEEKNKPWYLQPLVYEEEKEEEFQTGEPTHEECMLRSCRKYGI